MNELIKIYEDVLSPDVCKQIIDLFEASGDDHVLQKQDPIRYFIELNVNQHSKWSDIQNLLVGAARSAISKYIIDCHINPTLQLPLRYGFEQFRIKRYLPGEDQRFGPHVDVQDHNSARRFLSFFWYLNDVDEGGETEFFDFVNQKQHLLIKPKAGTLLMFPPLWMYPHQGLPPVSNAKYIAHSYLHYV